MKQRLDTLLVDLGLAENQRKSKALIMAGKVRVNGQVEYKPDRKFEASISGRQDGVHSYQFSVQAEPDRYVSRGGIKLQKALKKFQIDAEGLTALDVGASAGGFTDCLLQSGAKKVYAVDVGHGQLSWKLRQDPRVVVMEKTNARYLKYDDFGFPFDIATVDVSFISLRIILPAIAKLIRPDGNIIALIKPEFEARRSLVKKGGVIKDPKVHADVIENLIKIARQNGIFDRDLTYSPIRGPAGNIEFLALFNTLQERDLDLEIRSVSSKISQVVKEAHEDFGG